MKITKLGHCCLFIEENGLRILIDPGDYSAGQNEIKNVCVILITHEHEDHVHVESLQKILENSPNAKICTNNGVGKILEEKGIAFQLLAHGMKAEINGVEIEAFGEKHTQIYKTVPQAENTGYFIAGRLFYPGDAFTMPPKKVEILALPVSGPWMKLSEAIEYGLAVHPKTSFPVHDGMLKEGRLGSTHFLPQKIFSEKGISFVVLEEGKETEF